METLKKDIFNALRELDKNQFDEFKWHLQQPVNLQGLRKINCSALENAVKTRTTDLIAQAYNPDDAAQIMVNVLKEIPRWDLLTPFSNIHKDQTKRSSKNVPEKRGKTTVPNPEPASDVKPILQADFYTLSHNPRGLCLIINNEIFNNGMAKRQGTMKDAEALSRVFSRLGFMVKVQTNNTVDDIRRLLGGWDFTCADALVVCVLSHGDVGCVFGSDGKKVSLKEVMEPFRSRNSPSLAGKPKLFFIQACQGRGYQRGATAASTSSEAQEDRAQSQVQEDGGWTHRPEVVPDDADFLIGMATVDDYVSFRDKTKGSIYIQALCEQLDKAAQKGGEDILSVLTGVNREVCKGQYNDKKQMPECRNRLTKKLVLNFI